MSGMPEARELRLITFRVGPETFVFDIMAVRQIVPYSGSTSVPTAPAFVEGVVVLRNEVIPIIDLRDRMYPGKIDRAEEALVIIAHTTAGVVGLKVDEVRRIVTVTMDELLPAPPLVRGVRGELLVAVVPHGDEIYLLIDLDHILTTDEQNELRISNLDAAS